VAFAVVFVFEYMGPKVNALVLAVPPFIAALIWCVPMNAEI